MVSEFLKLGGKPAALDIISDSELATPRRYATECFAYGNDVIDHTVRAIIPIFNTVFPGCQAVVFI